MKLTIPDIPVVVRGDTAAQYREVMGVLNVLGKLGIDKIAEIALETAWKDADAVYMSFDIDSVDCGFVPGTGWPEPGGFLPREALGLVSRIAKEGLCGLEIVEVSPPYDTSDITSLFAARVIVDTLGTMVAHGKMGAHKGIIDKPVSF